MDSRNTNVNRNRFDRVCRSATVSQNLNSSEGEAGGMKDYKLTVRRRTKEEKTEESVFKLSPVSVDTRGITTEQAGTLMDKVVAEVLTSIEIQANSTNSGFSRPVRIWIEEAPALPSAKAWMNAEPEIQEPE